PHSARDAPALPRKLKLTIKFTSSGHTSASTPRPSQPRLRGGGVSPAPAPGRWSRYTATPKTATSSAGVGGSFSRTERLSLRRTQLNCGASRTAGGISNDGLGFGRRALRAAGWGSGLGLDMTADLGFRT